jgi:hypothetical protein
MSAMMTENHILAFGSKPDITTSVELRGIRLIRSKRIQTAPRGFFACPSARLLQKPGTRCLAADEFAHLPPLAPPANRQPRVGLTLMPADCSSWLGSVQLCSSRLYFPLSHVCW